jgi:hypothetical protein
MKFNIKIFTFQRGTHHSVPNLLFCFEDMVRIENYLLRG